MKLGIMQPYFFPYIGYFALIANTDKWIVFDITQYTPKTWMNRNRILHPKEGWQYVSVPLSNSSISIKINEAKILDIKAAEGRILGQTEHYHRKAPYFNEVRKLIQDTFAATKTDSLVDLNVNSTKHVCKYIGIKFDHVIASEQNYKFHADMQPGDWALEISDQMKATEYVNPVGGEILFDKDKFAKRNIKLTILPAPKFTYDTAPYKFEEYLSIIDVLMWNDPDKVRKALQAE